MSAPEHNTPMDPPEHGGGGDARPAGAGAGNDRETRILLSAVRVGFAVLFIVVTFLAILNTSGQGIQGGFISLNAPAVLITALIVGVVVVGIDALTKRRRISTLGSLFVGLLIAILGTVLMGAVVDLLFQLYDIDNPSLRATTKVLIGIALTYLCITTVLQTKDDFRLVIPYVEFAKQIRGVRPMLLDSSVLIDGRFLGVAETGVLQAPVIVPRFVVNELQTLADSGDRMKRARGRRGLAMVTRLQRSPGLEVSIDEAQVAGAGVDQMLVELARSMPATIVTTDSGLAQVASIQNVRVLNLHDLALALRAPVGMGDRLAIRIVKAGEQPGQGVGYLDDGTMVVVDGAAERVDEEVEVVIGKSLQTAAGRLVFAEPASSHGVGRGAAPAGGERPENGPGPDAAEPGEEPGDGGTAPGPSARSVRPPVNPLGPGGRPRSNSRNPRR